MATRPNRKRASTRPARTKRAAAAKAPPAERARTLTLQRGEETFTFSEKLPLLPLRDVVVFPFMTIPLLVGRLPSINAIEKAVARDRVLFVVAQRRSEEIGRAHV